MPAPLPRWRGKCEEPAGEGGDVCNRKVVRMGYYTEPPPSGAGDGRRDHSEPDGDERRSHTRQVHGGRQVWAEVLPSALDFGGLHDKRSFTVELNWDAGKTAHAEGSLKWVSATHVVRIPIVIF
ncbi:hypothetical protein C2845_PM05G13350 [Panicum miliaceum]|uniref:Subtilisin-like protease fibronectin type-III domain-containing protein n=1 Tax=Panicum miliaceum TaxID=4540 RepID=A0A3L6SUR2_PANMI|nr:hypothetical protein C2845_PM05G13350 [Panicum miliaceum]